MKLSSLKISLFAAVAFLPGIVTGAPIQLTGTMVYSQDFDALGTSTVAWTNDSTLPGWYAQINNAAAGNALPTDGSADLNGLLNCGASGSIDRALGSKATGNAPGFANIAYAVSFQNSSASPIQFSKLIYTGELWRTNSTATTGLAEVYTLYYQISAAPVTNIISGPSSNTPAPGTNFTALDAAANWSSPTILPVSSQLDGNAAANRDTRNFIPPSSIVLQPGQFLMIKWTDTNRSNTDGFQAIDDVSVEFTQLTGSVTATATPGTRTRDFGADLPGNADDTFGFTASIAGTGSVSAAWSTADVNPPAGNAGSGPYGTPVVWTGFPIATKTVLISDSVNAVFNSTIGVDPILVIGSNNLVAAGTPILQDDVPLTGWTINDTARTLNQTDQAAAGDKIVNSKVIDLPGTGFVQFAADLNAIAGGSSGFEVADSFALQLIINGGAPVSVLGAADTNGDGRLTGFADQAGVGPELPGNDEPGVNRPFSFSYIIPDTATSLQIRIIGNSDSPSETYLVGNIRLNQPPASIFAALAGPSTFDNKGTDNPADDEFSGPVNIAAVNHAGTFWDSDSIPAAGLYATAVDTFGPFLVSAGAQPVNLYDRANAAITTSLTIPLPAAATLTVPAPANIIRIENGPGTADDSMSFSVTITGSNGGPGWTATGATPAAGAFGPVTFLIPAPLPVSPAAVTVADVSYPTVTQVLSVPVPGRYIFGHKDIGAGLLDLESALNTPPAVEWVNNDLARTLTMTAGLAADSVVASEILNLSGTGIVYFTANFNARETSAASNFESGDLFKAELVIDGGTAGEQIINLVTAYDTGDGSPAAGAGGGPNGPPDGYINGYQGIDIGGAGAEADYNPNRARDEFNRLGEVADNSLNNNFPLSYIIPAAANTVQLKIHGAGAASTETFLVSGVLFSTAAPVPDSDGDGVSNSDELTMGTDANDASDVLRLSQNAVIPSQIDFPAKAGRFYRLYVSDDSQEASHLAVWKDAVPLGLAVGTIAGNGIPASFSIIVAPGEPRRFFRLHVMATDGATGTGDWPATVP